MNQIDLKRFDLNLLAVFDALMQERHVGRAGERLGLTQPAVSHALARLRALADDTLFVKHARGVKPTARAIELAETIGPALAVLRASFGIRTAFDPSSASRTIVIGSSDYVELALLPAVVARLRHEAPKIDIRIRSITQGDVEQAMRRRDIDLAIGPLTASPGSVLATPLFSDRLVLVARQGHPGLAQPLTVEAFAGLHYLLVSQSGDASGIVDDALREFGLERRVALTIPHFSAAPFLIAETDLVAMLPERIAKPLCAPASVTIHDCPLDVPPWVVGIAQPQEGQMDPCLSWLVTLIRKVVSDGADGERIRQAV
ncbi:LysR family transcriptional regulator [Beijerinckia mobilis]|uniref:LysR family transcriptional regulator n=1 Tax=Beijerinckia mobilis TaxID=231434 RepID=UPI00068B3251|nr:LysR family transcriptional regulator [Beijerinckia mobilis]